MRGRKVRPAPAWLWWLRESGLADEQALAMNNRAALGVTRWHRCEKRQTFVSSARAAYTRAAPKSCYGRCIPRHPIMAACPTKCNALQGSQSWRKYNAEARK